MSYSRLIAALALISAIALVGCGPEVESNLVGVVDADNNGGAGGSGGGTVPDGSTGWLVPVDEVFDGGPGKDGIPSIDRPTFITASEVTYLSPSDLVLGVRVGDEIRAYPHAILDWHEIINDMIGTEAFAVTYCPLTGTGLGWSRLIDGDVTTFGVSGLLYNTNLIPYDRATGSNWSQIQSQCVNGVRIGRSAETFPMVETTWATWKAMYPQAPVISDQTGYFRSYGNFPYRDYRTNHEYLIFPIANDDPRLPRKERVVGLAVASVSRVYRINSFPDGVGIINDRLKDLNVVVIGSRLQNFGMVYNRRLGDGTILTFEPVQNSLPVVMKDSEGTSWDLFGRAVAGPRAGAQLGATESFIAYWFAWATFHNNPEIHGQ